MVDGFRILNLPVSVNDILIHPELEFLSNLNEGTGEIPANKPRIAEYNGLSFYVKNKKDKEGKIIIPLITYCQLFGSIHKYSNKGQHNHNDFNYKNLVDNLNDLSERFIIPLDTTFLNGVEFGVNVILPFAVNELFNAIVCHKHKEYKAMNIPGSNGIEIIFNSHIIKIYDKGKQYGLPFNLLRFEIKVTRMRYFEDNGIKIDTLSDLLNIDNLQVCGKLLVKSVSDLLFYDNAIDLDQISAEDGQILTTGNNPKYWTANKPKLNNCTPKKQYEAQRQKYYRFRDRYEETLFKHQITDFKKLLSSLIESKVNNLLQIHQSEMLQMYRPKKDKPKDEMLQSHILSIVGICNNTIVLPKMCIDRLIDNQLMLGVGLKFIHDRYPELYDRVCISHLGEGFKKYPFDIQIRQIEQKIDSIIPHRYVHLATKRLFSYSELFN